MLVSRSVDTVEYRAIVDVVIYVYTNVQHYVTIINTLILCIYNLNKVW